MSASFSPAAPPERVLLGPGPSAIEPSVARALSLPPLGHLDPRLFEIEDEIRAMLRAIYATENEWTLAVSGTGTSGMEGVLVNLIEPGERVLVAAHGYFGLRLADIAERCGARVSVVEGEWGRASDAERLRKAAGGLEHKLVAVVHAETSTGVLQDLAPMRALADELGALLVADAVTSLGCVEVEADARGIDAAYSCTQKGLSCSPGLSPLTLSSRASKAVLARKDKVRSFYLDLPLLVRYWAGDHAYHHTISSHLLYALHEAARLVLAEGLAARFARHRLHGRALAAGLEAAGLELLVPASERLPQLCAVRIPSGVDDGAVRSRLLAEYGIEIGGGLGPLKGKLWRVGLMGAGATRRNVVLLLSALRAVMRAQGFREKEDPLAAAESCYAAAGGRA